MREKTVAALGDPDFQELFQSVYDGAIICTKTGKVVDANARASIFLQFTRLELLALNLTDIISGADSSTLTTLRAGLEKDRFIFIQAYCSRKDKSLFPVEIAVNPLTVSGTDYFCCFVRDISWRRRAEEMLKTIHAAIQNAATGIVITDLSGHIEYANQAASRLCGDTKSISGRKLQALLKDDTIFPAMLAVIQGGSNWSDEVLLKRNNGQLIHVQLGAAPNRDADEALTGMILSILDISDRVRAQAAESQAERQNVMMVSLGAACHHLGQPATVLLASLEMMARVKDNDRAMGDELLASSIDAAESLRKMLHNLNDITEYKTTAYIEGQGGSSPSETLILDVNKR